MIKIIDKLGLVHIKSGQLLVARSKGKDIYYIPGGKREQGETDQEALTRECQEELSVTLDPNTFKKVGVFDAPAHGKSESASVQVTAYAANFLESPKASSEIEELAWVTFNQIKRCSQVTQKIMIYLHENKLLIM